MKKDLKYCKGIYYAAHDILKSIYEVIIFVGWRKSVTTFYFVYVVSASASASAGCLYDFVILKCRLLCFC